ncbi:MAG: BppU family phage baseplate upper protein, partial [Staphylococcus equorum]|nr:BppU family phage baseplate upper protein [Staphylococcus equorum]
MAINKIAKFELKNEPYLKPIANFGFGFYNIDKNTATLKIQITRNNAPLLVGEDNALVWGLFQSENKSSTGTQELEIVDAMNGIVQITLDHEFLQASTDTTVNAQVYVAPRNGDDIAALNEFSFKVKDALINQIDAVSKITYIRMFDDLKARIENKVFEIEEAIKNIDDYVVRVETASTQAQKDIILLKDNSIKEIENKSNAEQTNLDDKITSANVSLTQITDANIEQVNTAKNEAVTASNNARTEIESKVAGFKTEVELREVFMTPEQADAKYLTVQDDDNYAT